MDPDALPPWGRAGNATSEDSSGLDERACAAICGVAEELWHNHVRAIFHENLDPVDLPAFVDVSVLTRPVVQCPGAPALLDQLDPVDSAAKSGAVA